jgi:hypothetical protein
MDAMPFDKMMMQGRESYRVIQPLAHDGAAEWTDECLSAWGVQLAGIIPECQDMSPVISEEADHDVLPVDGESHAPQAVGLEETSQLLKHFPVIDQEPEISSMAGGHAGILAAVEAVDIPVAAHRLVLLLSAGRLAQRRA